MKTLSRTQCYVYWFLPILILSGEVLSAKGKLKLVKRLKNNANHHNHNGSVSLLHSHHSPVCPGPNCKSNGEHPEDKNRLKRNNVNFNFPGNPQQWNQQQQNFPQFNQQPNIQFPVPHDNLMGNPHPMMDIVGPSAAPQMQQQFGGGMMPAMARSDNGQGIPSGPNEQFPTVPSSGSGAPNNFQQGPPPGPAGQFPNQPVGNNDQFQGTAGGLPQNPIPFGSHPDTTGMNSQPPSPPNLPQNQQQARFGEPMEQQAGGFQEHNNNFNNNFNPSSQSNFQGPQQQQFNNQQPFLPNNQFQDPNLNNNVPQFPQNNIPPDQIGAGSFQQPNYNGNVNHGNEMGFPHQGDPNSVPHNLPAVNPFPFPPTENNFPFPNQPQMNPNNFQIPNPNQQQQNFNSPQNFPSQQVQPGGNNPLVAFPHNNQQHQQPFPNQFQLGQPTPTNSSFYSPRTMSSDASGDNNYNNDQYNSNDGYEESETQLSNYHDDYYEDEYKKKHHNSNQNHGGGHILFNKHKSFKFNEDHVVSLVIQVAWKIISSYIFVFVANMLIGFLGKATGLSDSYVETHITLGNDGKHPFGNYGDGKGGPGGPHASSYGSPGGPGGPGGGKGKGVYALSNGLYHPASALYQHPTYQYHKGGKEHTLLGYDQYHAVKYAKKYSKKYAKKSGKYGLRPKPIGPYLPAYQYGLPPGPLALGWTAGSGGPNGFYKRTGTSAEPMKAKDDKNKQGKGGHAESKNNGRNGDGIKIVDNNRRKQQVQANSTEVSESEEDESEEGDEGEGPNATLLSVANETLSITTLPTVESNTAEEEERDDSSGEDELTTTLLPIVPSDDNENDIIKTLAAADANSNNITSTVSSTISTTTPVATRIETADGLYTFKTGIRGNSRIFSSSSKPAK